MDKICSLCGMYRKDKMFCPNCGSHKYKIYEDKKKKDEETKYSA